MYYTVYKITNKVNGKVYIGTHKTKNLDDNYYGSGKYLTNAINKYGIENFEKEILFVFDNQEDMFSQEAELVNEEFVASDDTYNLKIGGFGGWDHVNNSDMKIEYCKRGYEKANLSGAFSRKLKEDSNFRLRISESRKNKWKELSEDEKEERRKHLRDISPKSHSDETRQLISEKMRKIMSDPKNNGMYGKKWCHNTKTKENLLVDANNIPRGYVLGKAKRV